MKAVILESLQKCDAVEKMQLGHSLRLSDGREVHDLVFFDQRLPERAERVDLLRR